MSVCRDLLSLIVEYTKPPPSHKIVVIHIDRGKTYYDPDDETSFKSVIVIYMHIYIHCMTGYYKNNKY